MELLKLYSAQPRPYSELIKEVDVLKEARRKRTSAIKQGSAPGSPAINSQGTSPASGSPGNGELAKVAEIKKLIDEQAKDRSRSRSHGNNSRKEGGRRDRKDHHRHHHHSSRHHKRRSRSRERRSRSHSRERRRKDRKDRKRSRD